MKEIITIQYSWDDKGTLPDWAKQELREAAEKRIVEMMSKGYCEGELRYELEDNDAILHDFKGWFTVAKTPEKPQSADDGPDVEDGCEKEGFPGGCARMGCCGHPKPTAEVFHRGANVLADIKVFHYLDNPHAFRPKPIVTIEHPEVQGPVTLSCEGRAEYAVRLVRALLSGFEQLTYGMLGRTTVSEAFSGIFPELLDTVKRFERHAVTDALLAVVGSHSKQIVHAWRINRDYGSLDLNWRNDENRDV